MYIKLSHLALLIGFLLLIDFIHTARHAKKKLSSKKKANSQKEKTKSVSSDRVPNGGRKGPMSGGKNGQGLPMPVALPFPVIPVRKKRKQKKKKKQQQAEQSKNDSKSVLHDESDRNIKLPKSKGSKTQRIDDEARVVYNNANKTLIRSEIDNTLTRLKRSHDTDLDDDEEETDAEIREKIKEKLREKREYSRFKRTMEDNDHELSDEQIQLAEEWINEDDFNLVPGVEKSYFSAPNNLDFIWQGHSILSEAYNSLMPHLSMYKRSIDDDEDQVDDLMLMNSNANKALSLSKRDIEKEVGLDKKNVDDDDSVNMMLLNAATELERKMNTREIPIDEDRAEDNEEELDIVNEDADFDDDMTQDREARDAAIADEPPMSVEDAQREFENADKAAAALTKLEMGIGIDPEHLVTDTHKYVTSLQAEKEKYDQDIRAHIEKAQDAEKRASIAVHDEISKKSEISRDVAAAKRQLDDDRRKIEEINTELKQLKDIELMATGLEVAKYMAKERARHNLELAQSKATVSHPPQQQSAPPVSYMPQTLAPVMTMPQQQVLAPAPQPVPILHEPVPATMIHQPVGASTVIPSYGTVHSQASMYQAPSPPAVQMHQLGEQRHTAARPTFGAPPIQQPLTQYFSNYLQSKNEMQNQFATSTPVVATSAFTPHFIQHPSFVPYIPPVVVDNHIRGDQRHTPARAQSTYMIRPMGPSVFAPATYLTSFARGPKPKTVGAADHEITEFEKSHGHGNKDQKQPTEDHDGVLWFPGSTYSPPPAWNHNAPGPYMRQQAARTQYYPPPGQAVSIPQQHSGYAVHQSQVPLAEALTAISPLHQYAQQSSLSSAPVSATYATAQPPPPIVPFVPLAQQQPSSYASPPVYQSSIFPETTMEMRPGAIPLTQPYAQQAKAGEVINENPPDKVVTMNQKPPPPPPQPPKPDMSGTLPPWMGAVDGAKYENDVSDRLRQKPGSEKPKDNDQENSDNPNVKREYLRLIHAEDQLGDVQKASNAVTHVESAIGFDPGSIAKMVDFVKTAAKKDVKLSQEAVDKDQQQLHKIQADDSVVKKSDIAKKSDIDSVALEHAKSKLHTDEAVLADAKDRLDKIDKMELIVTEIEVAKFYASIKAEKEVQGAKRTLEALKRNGVTRPQ